MANEEFERARSTKLQIIQSIDALHQRMATVEPKVRAAPVVPPNAACG